PLKERGLERFQHPQHPLEMLTNGDRPTNTAYLRPALGGDMALLRGMAKFLLQWERDAQAAGEPAVFDHAFLNEHTAGILDYISSLDDTSWEHIVEQSGLTLVDIERAARMYLKGKNVIMCWAMGITQHRHSVQTIQEIANLMLLRGNIGRPGAGLCPVRGHSNVQGDRTMGINERPPVAFLDALERRFNFKVPRENGHNVVEAIHAMLEGRAKVFIGLGGNFAQATPDSPRTAEALRNCDLTVQISTKLNRSHLMHGKEALILPCLGRTDIDHQAEGPQAVTVEDSFSMVHASNGQLKALSNQMRSEPAIIAGIAAATLGTHPIDWNWIVADYGRIRELIADTIPGFKDFNTRIQNPGGFYLGNSAGARQWNTPTQRANFRINALPQDLIDARTRATGKLPDLILQSMRSHDQYNTTIYGLDDRYRGVKGQRDVLFVNEADIIRLGFKPGQKVDIVSIWDDQHERRVKNFTLLAFDIPAGQAAAYYPEVNPLVPLESTGDGSHTPTSKFVAICLEAASPSRLIMAKAS
ncbi:MAG: FdhF/YdeP family oxidoreductase, partial [Pseudomonas sp.]|nr:FdhF/YdeP family oxidoreductase [Pseudomonas sp.]